MENSSESYYSIYQEKATELNNRLAEIEDLLKELDLDLLDKEIKEGRLVFDSRSREAQAVAARVGSQAKIAELIRERRRISEEIYSLGIEDNEAYHKLIDFKSRNIN